MRIVSPPWKYSVCQIISTFLVGWFVDICSWLCFSRICCQRLLLCWIELAYQEAFPLNCGDGGGFRGLAVSFFFLSFQVWLPGVHWCKRRQGSIRHEGRHREMAKGNHRGHLIAQALFTTTLQSVAYQSKFNFSEDVHQIVKIFEVSSSVNCSLNKLMLFWLGRVIIISGRIILKISHYSNTNILGKICFIGGILI